MFFDRIYQNTEPVEQSFEVKIALFSTKYKLTARETEVISIVLTSKKKLKDIAADLFISPSTLEKHMTNIYVKTGTKNRAELMNLFFEIPTQIVRNNEL